MKYYCLFYYNGYLFPTYVEAESYRDALDIGYNAEFSLAGISGGKGFNNYFRLSYPQLPKTISGKDIVNGAYYKRRGLSFIKKLIREGKVKEKCSLFKTNIDFRSLLDYSQGVIHEKFDNLCRTISNPDDIRKFTGLSEVESISKYTGISEDEAKLLFYKHQRQNKEIWPLYAINKKSFYFQYKNIPYLRKANLFYRLADTYPGFLMDIYQQEYPCECGWLKRVFCLLMKPILEGYGGVKIDGNSPDGVHTRFLQWYNITRNEEFVPGLAQNDSRKSYFSLSNELKYAVLASLDVPYDKFEGTYCMKTLLFEKEVTFKTQMKLTSYGQSIIVKWNNIKIPE